MTDTTPRVMLTVEQVLALVPVSHTTLWRMERDKRFPAGHMMSPGRKVWFADEIAAWQEALPASRVVSR